MLTPEMEGGRRQKKNIGRDPGYNIVLGGEGGGENLKLVMLCVDGLA